MTDLADVNDDTFQADVLEAEGPVLVDFGADWCAPCKQLDPIIEELAEEWSDRVTVRKMDVDHNVNTAMAFGVMGVPTLILFVGGEARERMTGYQPKQKIVDKLAPHLG